MTVDVENLRLRLAKGDTVCLNEHTIHQDDDPPNGKRRLWLTCGDETFAEAEWSDQMLAEERHRPWVEWSIEHHRAVVAERLVGELLAALTEIAACPNEGPFLRHLAHTALGQGETDGN